MPRLRQTMDGTTMKTVTCIICEKEVENMTYEGGDPNGVHPMDGTAFTSYGHYGSTVFDPMDGSTITLVICNGCLKGHKEEFLYHKEPHPDYVSWVDAHLKVDYDKIKEGVAEDGGCKDWPCDYACLRRGSCNHMKEKTDE